MAGTNFSFQLPDEMPCSFRKTKLPGEIHVEKFRLAVVPTRLFLLKMERFESFHGFQDIGPIGKGRKTEVAFSRRTKS